MVLLIVVHIQVDIVIRLVEVILMQAMVEAIRLAEVMAAEEVMLNIYVKVLRKKIFKRNR
jgi:hypothetical protein